jgi:hypothetical protein
MPDPRKVPAFLFYLPSPEVEKNLSLLCIVLLHGTVDEGFFLQNLRLPSSHDILYNRTAY